MKKYIIFAGVNGSGKSTLFHLQNGMENMPRVNMDEIVSSLGDWRDHAVQLQAGKIAANLLSGYLEGEVSFNQETTLCGRGIIKNIKYAREKGFLIEMHYVGVESSEIAKERVLYRVRMGGHGINEADIERRYLETFRNLKEIIPYCDLLALYDNSERFRRFAIYRRNHIIRLSSNVPRWYEKYNGCLSYALNDCRRRFGTPSKVT